MKLKEIKQDMAIHCTSRDQLQCLVNIGVADENLTKYDVPIWIHVFGNGICCWMPEVDKNGMKGKEFYEKDEKILFFCVFCPKTACFDVGVKKM